MLTRAPFGLLVLTLSVLLLPALGSPAAAQTTVRSGDITGVDFRNFTLPRAGGLCLSEHAVALRDGEYKRESGPLDREYVWMADVAFGTLSGSPAREAVVVVKCSGGGSGVFSQGLVFGLKDGKPILIATFDGGDRAQGGIHAARVERQRLLVERLVRGD